MIIGDNTNNYYVTVSSTGGALVDQGVAAAASGSWPVEVTDGTNILGTPTHPLRTDPTGTTVQPISGQVAASGETSTIYNGATALTPLFATLTASASGATTVIAAVGGKRIRVIAYDFMANGTVNVKFQSHVTPTDLTGLYYLIANTGKVNNFNPVGWFQTVSGEALDINLSGNISVGGSIVYVTI